MTFHTETYQNLLTVVGYNRGSKLYLQSLAKYIFMDKYSGMLQAGRSPVPFPIKSLYFSIHLILPAALWSWGRLSL
jgi:hypothetical protein